MLEPEPYDLCPIRYAVPVVFLPPAYTVPQGGEAVSCSAARTTVGRYNTIHVNWPVPEQTLSQQNQFVIRRDSKARKELEGRWTPEPAAERAPSNRPAAVDWCWALRQSTPGIGRRGVWAREPINVPACLVSRLGTLGFYCVAKPPPDCLS